VLFSFVQYCLSEQAAIITFDIVDLNNKIFSTQTRDRPEYKKDLNISC
jgi:hypothetical protein